MEAVKEMEFGTEVAYGTSMIPKLWVRV